MGRQRLLRRLGGPDAAPVPLLTDLARLLGQRLGDAPACPHLGLPATPVWLPDVDGRRQLQEAMATTLRQGEPRLTEVRVGQRSEDGRHAFVVQAQVAEAPALGAAIRFDARGRMTPA